MLSMPRVHRNECLETTPLAYSGINDRLVKLRPLIDQTFWVHQRQLFCCFLFSAYNTYCQKTIKLHGALCRIDEANV